MSGARRPRAAGILAIVALAMLISACASRIPHEEHVAMATGGRSTGGVAGGSGGAGGTGAANDTTGSGAVFDAGAGAGATGVAGAAGAGGTFGDTATGGSGGDEAVGGGGSGGGPIRIGMIGMFSGIAGASFGPARDAYKAWVGMINAKGGINGHPIEFLVGDDGGEGARDLAIAKDFVENRGVIAIVNYYGAAGGPEAVAAYAEEKRVPVIGGAAFDATFYRSPMMFPAITGLENFYFSNAQAMNERGMNKVAIVYCTEGAVCKENADTFRRHAESLGMEVVYEAPVSLAQPDFTAECINARAAGANGWYPQVDGNSVNRLARSCARQNFNPGYFVTAPVPDQDPLLNGAISTLRSFPWMIDSGSPALEEYGQAMRQFAPDSVGNSFTTWGWTAAKLLEAAAQNVSTEPTSADILAGLWAMRGETLGGLSPALTFVEGQPATGANCAFFAEVQNGEWAAPRGMELIGCM